MTDAYLGDQQVDRRSQESGCRTLPAEPAGIRPQGRGRFQNGNGGKKFLDPARVVRDTARSSSKRMGSQVTTSAPRMISSNRALSAAGVRFLK